MRRFQWNALRVGDRVLVHDQGRDDLRLQSGVVAIVDALRRANGVGVRLASDLPEPVVWPARLRVHLEPLDPTEPCWCCDARSQAMATGTA